MGRRKEILKDEKGRCIYPDWAIRSFRLRKDLTARAEKICEKQRWKLNNVVAIAIEAYCDQYEGVEMDEMARRL